MENKLAIGDRVKYTGIIPTLTSRFGYVTELHTQNIAVVDFDGTLVYVSYSCLQPVISSRIRHVNKV